MRPSPSTWLLAGLLLVGCTSSSRIDRSWDVFEVRRDVCMERADAVVDLYRQQPRTPEDEEMLAWISQPPGSPAGLVILTAVHAATAYMANDPDGMRDALAELDRCEEYIEVLEARHSSRVAGAARPGE